MEDIIQELCQEQGVGTHQYYNCPFCVEKRGRPILRIIKDTNCIKYHCFSANCEAHGHKYMSIGGCNPDAVKRAILNKRKKEKPLSKFTFDLPEVSPQGIPPKFIQYLDKYYIGRELIEKYNMYHCQEHWWNGVLRWEDRLVIPTPSGFVARSLDTEPKWRNYTNYDFFSTGQKQANKLVLVEDPLSCIRVGEVMPSYCLFGTKIVDIGLIGIPNYKEIIIWLDGDFSGIKGRIKIFNKLSPYIPCKIINTKYDPKCYSKGEIGDILKC